MSNGIANEPNAGEPKAPLRQPTPAEEKIVSNTRFATLQAIATAVAPTVKETDQKPSQAEIDAMTRHLNGLLRHNPDFMVTTLTDALQVDRERIEGENLESLKAYDFINAVAYFPYVNIRDTAKSEMLFNLIKRLQPKWKEGQVASAYDKIIKRVWNAAEFMRTESTGEKH